MKKIETGKIGENMACRYLLNNVYSILARNHKERFDEIDIIARHQNGTLVFCEVKTINSDKEMSVGGFMPEDNLNHVKRGRMIRGAEVFLARHPGLIIENAGWQIDLIAIVIKNGKMIDLRHYENI